LKELSNWWIYCRSYCRRERCHRRLTYLGHVTRMAPERLPNILLLHSYRPRGRDQGRSG